MAQLAEPEQRTRLWAAVERKLAKAKMGMSEGSESALRTLVANGEGRLGQAVSPQDVEQARNLQDEAERNLERFVDAMIKDARQKGYTELHEDTFQAAMSSLCPLFPFC